MITTNDIQGIIALAILNNKSGVIDAMNNTGNPVSSGISDADLAAKLWNIYTAKGVAELNKVLSRVSIDKDRITQQEAQALAVKFKGADPNAKFGDWIKGVGTYFGDLLGGTTVSGGTVQQMFSESALSPSIIALIVVIGLTLMVLFRKSIALVIGIIVVILSVVLLGIFSKKITTITTGGGTTSHGGVGQVVLGWLTGIF